MTDLLGMLLSVVLLSALIIAVQRRLFTKVTIFEYERGLKYRRGQFQAVIGAGQYWIYKPGTTVVKVDMRPHFISVPGQEVLSSDAITLKVSLAAQYEVADPAVAINRVDSYQSALYLVLQIAAREVISSRTVDELIASRTLISEEVRQVAAARVEELGLRLLSVSVKDMMLPGDLKKIFAQAVKARKEGQAALERARGETAALRHLANAARMVEERPALMQLRVLQSVSDSSGSTLVLGLPSTFNPLPIKAHGRSEGQERLPGTEGESQE
ncbi:MAG: membrane protein [Herpetosiphonaceae bacterium]|nr:MAG: membrane protein [Herpetosiphonaceae bacterium]